jgi:hypothetical protein
MSIVFTRTATGIVGKWRFYNVPTLWVEGPTDIHFYAPVVRGIACRIEAFHGVENAAALLEGLRKHDHPYVVVVDGDYVALTQNRNPHRRYIRLRRYSHENYLWEEVAFSNSCLRHAQCGEQIDTCSIAFCETTAHLEEQCRELLTLDVAARMMPSPCEVLPRHVEALLISPTSPTFDSTKVQQIIQRSRDSVPIEVVKDAEVLISEYTSRFRLIDAISGHIVFGCLRILFTKVSTEIRGKKSVVSDDALRQIVADEVWRTQPSADHKKLRSSIRRQLQATLGAFA